MECKVCQQNDVEFTGNRKVCNQCQNTLKELQKEKQYCEYCGLNEDEVKFTKSQKAIVCKLCKRDYTLDLKKERHYRVYKEYYEQNREAIINKTKKWNKENKEKRFIVKKNYRERHKNEINFRIRENLSGRLHYIIKKKGCSIIDFLDCSIDNFKKWLEFNFKEGMTFENYGSYWHIDHAKPCKLFDFSKNEDIQECWHWSNLVPLEKNKNESKGAKHDPEYIEYYKNRSKIFIESVLDTEGSETKRLSAMLESLKI